MIRSVFIMLLGATLAGGMTSGCGGSTTPAARRSTARRGGPTATSPTPVEDHGRCDASGADREVSEDDTSGDSTPDVRRVFRRVGDPPVTRLVLSCREVDLNGDGVKDVIRYYSDDGRPQREESDRNFDGRLDTITVYQEGRVVRTERDANGDTRIDTKTFFDDRGEPVRIERDLAGRSTAEVWRPDRWEYFEDGRVVRMGTDVDGDAEGRVDRWDRDHQYAAPPGEGGADASGSAEDVAASASP